jgi:hypothetical protein
VRFALWGLVLAAVIFIISGGHILFLPLFFLLPLGRLSRTGGAIGVGGRGLYTDHANGRSRV